MNFVDSHKKIIAWYQAKMGLSDYGLLWVVFFKGVLVTIIVERLIFN
tara:strand:- start:469 stop:609 length:141 start_codon:yes stop_codon:yes gene_type:complete